MHNTNIGTLSALKYPIPTIINILSRVKGTIKLTIGNQNASFGIKKKIDGDAGRQRNGFLNYYF